MRSFTTGIETGSHTTDKGMQGDDVLLNKGIRWLSSFESLDDVLRWLERHHVFAYAKHVRDAWQALERRKPQSHLAKHRLDYRMKVHKTPRSTWLDIQRRFYEVEAQKDA